MLPDSVTAIDILLEPDAAMIARSAAANARLLEAFPEGFALDATHHPHITMLQRYVRTADLDRVCAAAAKVIAGENVTRWNLEAFKYYYIPYNVLPSKEDIGLCGIAIKATKDLLRLQQRLVDAVAPLAAKAGTAAAFATAPAGADIDPFLIEYTAAFVPKATGASFNPHVTIGLATEDYLKAMLAEPFAAFTFSPAGASVYQLGAFGTAARKLRAL
jgi:hypothetical protein